MAKVRLIKGTCISFIKRKDSLVSDEEGVALTETIIVLPIMIVFLVGILEFGMLLFAKSTVESGLREASRYLSRCQNSTYGCTDLMAQNLAVFGNTMGNGSPRVSGWATSDITITSTGAGRRVSTTFTYAGSPLIGLIGLANIQVSAYHEDRYFGW